jgi:hypothetical protein
MPALTLWRPTCQIVLAFLSGVLWWVSASMTKDIPLTGDLERIDLSFVRMGASLDWPRTHAEVARLWLPC